MPELSRFFGIVIAMYYNDHDPPHFHAIFGESETVIEISSGRTIRGSLPRRANYLVLEWWSKNREAISVNWQLALQRKKLNRIDPLE